MSTPKVFESEYRFCLILWDHEPIKSRDLAQLCAEQLGWKVTTTYTVIKRLSERGVIKNEIRLFLRWYLRSRYRQLKLKNWLRKNLPVRFQLF